MHLLKTLNGSDSARSRGRRRSVVCALLAAVGTVSTLATWLLPDDLDRGEVEVLAPVIELGAGCWPASRVSAVHADNAGTLGWACSPTIVGWPRFRNSASCHDGEWDVSGVLDLRGAGPCTSTHARAMARLSDD
jgi:hypothetical protein